MNQQIAISVFKATCLKVLSQVKKTGNPVLVTKRGKPIAVIEPPPPPKKTKSWLGKYRETGKITGDIISPVISAEEWEVLK